MLTRAVGRLTPCLAAGMLCLTLSHDGRILHAQPAPGAASAAAAASPDLDPRVVKLLGSISEERLRQLLEKLVSFGTRNTLSSADSPTRGIGAARQWIFDEMKRSSARLQVSFDTHQIPQGGRITRPVELRNVVAILPGKSPRRIYISGHYDTVNLAQSRSAGGTQSAPNHDIDAPGANDDGSGTVLAMELARVFAESGIEFDATLAFVAFAGEEQGLVGARAHAEQAQKNNVPIQAVLNNDIVGNTTSGAGLTDSQSIKVYSEGPEDSASRSLARFVVRQGARYVPSHRVRPLSRHDRFGRGGDHSAFNQSGFPGIVFRESRENYSKQHNAVDTIDGVSFPYLMQNARVNAAAAATMALAPPSPDIKGERGPTLTRQPSGYDANLTWQAAPGAAGYRIFWRNAWTPDWEHEMTVGNVTEYVFPNVSIDEYVFGVAAIGPGGHESPVAAYMYAPRRY